MSVLIPYLIGVLLVFILLTLISLNFIRFRFEGDKTLFFIGLFALAFIGNVIFTLSILNYNV